MQSVTYRNIEPFWDDQYQHLRYINEDFNSPDDLEKWRQQGFATRFTGDMCDMRSPQPTWNNSIIDYFSDLGWKDIGTSYYRMMPGTVLPTHQDKYVKYIDIFKLQGKETSIRRAVVFLEDWQSGHYAEYQARPFVNWRAGAVAEWTYDTPHLAANLGETPRYTLQVTGHL